MKKTLWNSTLLIGGYLLLCPASLLAQAQEKLPNVQQEMEWENLAASNDAWTEDDSQVQLLEQFRRHPIDLNRATSEELVQLHLLTPQQILSLIRYRELLGNFVTIYELQAVPGFDWSVIQRILPYVRVVDLPDINRFKDYWRKGDAAALFRYSRVLEQGPGYQDSNAAATRFVGDPNKIFFRYRYQFVQHMSYGVTAEKDAGEAFFRFPQRYGFDFYSVHFFLRNYKKLKALALGDFTVNMGQGLVNWQGLAFKKTAAVMNIQREGPVLKPYSSAGELYFFRGAGLTFQQGNWQATTFASYRQLDGYLTVADSTGTFQTVVSSLQTRGYHRTKAEINGRNALALTSLGGILRYQVRQGHIGLNGIYHLFSKALQPRATPDNEAAFRGRQLWNVSMDYAFGLANLYFFGEMAMAGNRSWAMVSGWLLSVDPRASLGMLYRHIGKGYQGLFANAFTEAGELSNEQGLYLSASMRPLPGLRLDAYADLFRFPGLRYRVSAPSNGQDYLLMLTYQPSRQANLYLRYRQQQHEMNNERTPIPSLLPTVLTNWRLQLDFKLSESWSLGNRWEGNRYVGKEAEKGWLAYEEAFYHPLRSKWRGSLRWSYFNITGYNARIYTYENDVLYYFSIPSFWGKGHRIYLNIAHQFNRHLRCWLRIAQTRAVKPVSPAGQDPVQTEFKAQLQWQF